MQLKLSLKFEALFPTDDFWHFSTREKVYNVLDQLSSRNPNVIHLFLMKPYRQGTILKYCQMHGCTLHHAKNAKVGLYCTPWRRTHSLLKTMVGLTQLYPLSANFLHLYEDFERIYLVGKVVTIQRFSSTFNLISKPSSDQSTLLPFPVSISFEKILARQS